MIDRGADRSAYKQLADLLRDRIISGALTPGTRLPSETSLAQEHDLSRNTVRQAMRQLAAEGLITIDPPHGTFVRDRGHVETITLGPGDQVDIEATGTVVVIRADGSRETYPAGTVRVVGGR